MATTLPLTTDAIQTPGGGLPAFFAGLLPEGHRLTVLKDAAKTSFNDELTLLEEIWLEKLQPFGERGYNSSAKIREA